MRIVAIDSLRLFIQNGLNAVVNSDPLVVAIPIKWMDETAEKPRIQFSTSGPIGDDLVATDYFRLENTKNFHVCIQVISDSSEAEEISSVLINAFDTNVFDSTLDAGVFWKDGSPPLFTCAITKTYDPEIITVDGETRVILEFDLDVTDAGAVDAL